MRQEEGSLVVGQLNFRLWLDRVLGWDGLLPLGIVLVPMAIRLVMPDKPAIIEVAAVLLPIAAMVIRIRVGNRHIAANHCSSGVRDFQYLVLALATLLLLLIDVFFIAISLWLPPGAPIAIGSEWLVIGLLIFSYLILIAVAMYPGRMTADIDPSLRQETGESSEAAEQGTV